MYPAGNEKIIITRRVPCRHQNLRTKKSPSSRHSNLRPATAPAESCCTDHNCAGETASAEQPLNGARYSWQVEGMDCAACARKVETAVRQIDGVRQVQVLFATEKLLVNADSDIRSQVENAVRAAGYTLRDADAPQRRETARFMAAGKPGVIESGSDDGAQLGARAV